MSASPTPNPTPAPRPPRPPRKSGVIVPHAPVWHQRLAALLLFLVMRLVLGTMRCRLRTPSEFLSPGAPAPIIVCLWHNRLGSCIKALDAFRRPNNSGAGMTALVSASKDGAFLTRVLAYFNVQTVRGSSSRRGAQAMLELTTWAQRGNDITVTPDGPRGPCYQIQDGITSLAQTTGLPIVPVALNVNWKISVKSWDRFQIPLPFSRCDIRVGKTIRVPANATDAEREALRQQLQVEMMAITED